ncbi:MAG TPA: heparin lyase I family protein [Stellaceae bacterium]|nr:heparin lyase I family protein [Stellaceae bacterium]
MPGLAHAQAPQPVFAEDFAYVPGDLAALLRTWRISAALDRGVWASRVAVVADAARGGVLRMELHEGDALDGATDAARAAKSYVCGGDGSRAAQMEAEPGGIVPAERVEIQVKSDRPSGSGDIVKFGEPVWYRFSFKTGDDWPHDAPAAGRLPCRTVIQQIKQDSFRNGESCGASPFFKIEARPLKESVRFYAQIAFGDACASPPAVTRRLICETDTLPRATWASVNVRLLPALDQGGRADIWLNGRHCGSYRGPMGDAANGVRRDGVPVANTQPRFGIYRDWRAETQTIYFSGISFWSTDPTGSAGWGVGAPPL